MAKIQTYLKTFDKQDRYDFDGDGDFNEPDGYIDHFQIVHAGGDEADGDPVYGPDAIWSHRWNAQVEPYGTGPDGGAPIGGVNVGEGGSERRRCRADPGQPDRCLGQRLHDPARERRPVASSPTSSATTSVCLTSTTPARRRRTRSSTGTLMAQSRGTLPSDSRHRRPAAAVRRLGQVPARLARLRHRPRRSHRHLQDPPRLLDLGRPGQRPGRAAAEKQVDRASSVTPARPAARRTSTAAPATTSTTPCRATSTAAAS